MNPLRNFDPLLLQVIERSSDFFGIADAQGSAISINQSGRKIFGIDLEKDISDLNMLDFFAADVRRTLCQELEAKTLRSEKLKRTTSVKCFATGEVFNMDFDFFYIPENNGTGPMFMAVGKDLRASDFNLKRLNIFEAVIENSNDFVGIADTNFRPNYLNPAGRKLLGIPLDLPIDEVVLEDCYPEELRDFAKNEILKTMIQTGHWSGETNFQHFVTKEKIPVHDNHFTVLDPKSGALLGHATITRDMSKEKNLQKNVELEKTKMLQASKLATLGEMAAGIAHEINNPLSVIEASVGLLKRGNLDPGYVRKIDMISRSVDRISRIVKGLRKFSRGSEGINKSAFSSKSLIEDCFALLAGKAMSCRVQLIDTSEKETKIYADEVQVEQIVVNLINNSIDANSKVENAWVKTWTESELGYLKIVVQDSGDGIDEATVEKLFNPFFTTKPAGSGTGLGLSIAKGIANDHDGDLYYEKIGGHTAFVLKIPAWSA